VVLSTATEEALLLALRAADAVEDAGRNFGLFSEELRLAKAAHEHLLDDYQELLMLEQDIACLLCNDNGCGCFDCASIDS
jgi:hypothetical protein